MKRIHSLAAQIFLPLLVLVFGLSAPIGNAYAALMYDETTDGDLDGSQELNLSVGLNTISGTTGNGGNFGGTDTDDFYFTVPSGSLLESISLSFSLTNSGASSIFAQYQVSTAVVGIDYLSDSSPQTGLFDPALPLGTGGALITTALTCGGCDTGDFWTADYTWSFNVTSTAVPAPATLLLIGLGLAGLGFGMRRR